MAEQWEPMSSASCGRMPQCPLKQPEWGDQTKDISRAERKVSSGRRTTDRHCCWSVHTRARRNCWQQVTRQLGSQVAAHWRPQRPFTLARSDAWVRGREIVLRLETKDQEKKPLKDSEHNRSREMRLTRTNSFAQQPWRSARRIAPSLRDCRLKFDLLKKGQLASN